jgi:hypothetical protein
MIALANSGMRNIGDDSGAGFFGLDTHATNAPPGFGQPRDAQPGGEWWADHPKAQLHDVLARMNDTAGGSRQVSLDDPEALSRWAHDVQPNVDPSEYAAAHAAAQTMVDDCAHGNAPAIGGAGGHGALHVAQSQLGVREEGGANTGAKVDQYLGAAQVAPGNPWCASFVTWSLEQSGHEMPGGGWAAVSSWVHAAQAGQHGLSIVSPDQAQPGDIVAYDWGGGGDFGADGHIGFVDSTVNGDGSFTTVEGNSGDAVSHMSRHMGEANIVFIRAGG